MKDTEIRNSFQKVKREYYKKHPKICIKCGKDFGIHLHHILSVQDGGSNDFTNLATLCYSCHKDYHLHYDEITKNYEIANNNFSKFLNEPTIGESIAITKTILKFQNEIEMGKIEMKHIFNIFEMFYNFRCSIRDEKIQEFYMDAKI
jgi:hypothetical protein